MRGALRAAFAACLLLALALPLAGQGSAHHGVWLSAGVGHGSAQLTCAVCAGGRDGGLSGYLRGGVALTGRVLLGAEVLGWYRSPGAQDYLITSGQVVTLLYPWPRRGLYLKAGLGLARYSAKDTDDKASTQAFAGQVGAGWDVPVTRGIAVSPYISFLGTSGADLRFNDTVSNLSANTSLIQVGLGVTLQ